jgi:hypothetical protein
LKIHKNPRKTENRGSTGKTRNHTGSVKMPKRCSFGQRRRVAQSLQGLILNPRHLQMGMLQKPPNGLCILIFDIRQIIWPCSSKKVELEVCCRRLKTKISIAVIVWIWNLSPISVAIWTCYNSPGQWVVPVGIVKALTQKSCKWYQIALFVLIVISILNIVTEMPI